MISAESLFSPEYYVVNATKVQLISRNRALQLFLQTPLKYFIVNNFSLQIYVLGFEAYIVSKWRPVFCMYQQLGSFTWHSSYSGAAFILQMNFYTKVIYICSGHKMVKR